MIGLPTKEVVGIFDLAMGMGVNIVDIYMPDPRIRSDIGIALSGRRERMYIQGHICTTFQDGQYQRTRELEIAKASFGDLFTRLRTDYIDFGIIHYVDVESDLEELLRNGILEYAIDLKRQGIVRHLGFSSHNPLIARKLIADGVMDIFMFSINAAYDADATNNDDIEALMEFKGLEGDASGPAPLRASLYAECERQGVGITVMKALAAGRLLNAEDSPFGAALSVPQCMHYCLTRPVVLSCMLGIRSVGELAEGLKYYDASDAEKDFAAIARSPKYAMAGKCMYCNHCLPCPAGIDIAAVNKFLDLAALGDGVQQTVRGHYDAMSANGEDCTQCGACETRCPFGVEIIGRMMEARSVFR